MPGRDRRAVVLEVIEALLAYPERDSNYWLKNFPVESCSVVSYAVGYTLFKRYGERWLLLNHDAESDQVTGTPVHYSHVWLSLDPQGNGPSIDASMHQFAELAGQGPYVGESKSPFQERFAPIDRRFRSIPVDEVEDWWHHGQTLEVYEWLFPRLGVEWSPPA